MPLLCSCCIPPGDASLRAPSCLDLCPGAAVEDPHPVCRLVCWAPPGGSCQGVLAALLCGLASGAHQPVPILVLGGIWASRVGAVERECREWAHVCACVWNTGVRWLSCSPELLTCLLKWLQWLTVPLQAETRGGSAQWLR